MKVSCCDHVLCPGGATGPNSLEFDSPLANFTSQAPDIDTFLSLNFGWNHHSAPPIGSNWTRNSCLGICESTISQADADLCAARNNYLCLLNDGWRTPPPTINTGGPSTGPPLIPPPNGPVNPQFNLNQACQAQCPDGNKFTWAVAAGTFVAENQLLANQMAFSYACRLAAANMICMSDLAPSTACTNSPYSGKITITGANGPFTVTGQLPAGLNMAQSTDSKTIIIGGQTSATSTQQFTLMVTDNNGNFMTKTFSLKIITITGDPSGASFGNPFTFQFTASGGDGGPYGFQSFQPGPPQGLAVLPDGTLTGTPQVVGTFTFGVGATDKNGNTCTRQVTMTIAGVTNNPQTGTLPCANNPGIQVTATIPAGATNYPVGTNQLVADAAASQMLLNKLADLLQSAGCGCANGGERIVGTKIVNSACPTGAEACCRQWTNSCQGLQTVTAVGIDVISSCDTFIGNGNRPRQVNMTIPGFVTVIFYAP